LYLLISLSFPSPVKEGEAIRKLKKEGEKL